MVESHSMRCSLPTLYRLRASSYIQKNTCKQVNPPLILWSCLVNRFMSQSGMNCIRWSGCFLACALLPVGIFAVETPIEITPELKGAWVKPDAAWDGRTVLMLHGFAD